MKLTPLCIAIATLLSGLTLASHASAQDNPQQRRSYLVQLNDQPLASYTGNVAGLAATKPAAGKRLDLASAPARQYSAYLEQKLRKVQALVAAAPVQYEYKTVLNGFSAMLTDAEVRQLQASAEVAGISANAHSTLQTNDTPDFLGLTAPGGLWSQLGGSEHAGEDIIIGIIDSGISPENPAFADRVDAQGYPSFNPADKLAYGAPPARWQGACETGEGFKASDCNNKLIGARSFNKAFLTAGVGSHWSNLASPRDTPRNGGGGHGTHVAATASGNRGVAPTAGLSEDIRAVSGMAPRARTAAYKVFWSYLRNGWPTIGAIDADIAAAIEQAVIDGVHVLNLSGEGGRSLDNPVGLAFLRAADAGVYVVAAAGNAGPDNTAINHAGPWMTTVASTTHGTTPKLATLETAAGFRRTARTSSLAAVTASPLIYAQNAFRPEAKGYYEGHCTKNESSVYGKLDPALVRGKIVICKSAYSYTPDDTAVAAADAALAVAEAGGIAMLFYDSNTISGKTLAVPTLQLDAAAFDALVAYSRTPGASAALSAPVPDPGVPPIPQLADDSSHGPNQADPNQLKPDLAAPGVSVLAAYAAELNEQQHQNLIAGGAVPEPSWAVSSGTSMASPHVAGLGALLRQQHPDWSPAAIKSALMTTTASIYADKSEGIFQGKLPWGQGAGIVVPNNASDPGLVYDITPAQFRQYLCGMEVAGNCANGSLASVNLNVPSITLSNVLGNQTVSRSVRNVGKSAAVYQASATLSGYDVSVLPASLHLAPGETGNFKVTLQRTTAEKNVWQFGALLWDDGSHKVRIPVTARSGAMVEAPPMVRASGVKGSRLIGVRTAFNGKLNLVTAGLKEVTRTPLSVPITELYLVTSLAKRTDACAAQVSSVLSLPVSIPADTVIARFELFARDTAGGTGNDIDLVLIDGSNTLVGHSESNDTNESIVLRNPPPGNYRLCLLGFGNDGAPVATQLSSAIVSRADTGGKLVAAVPARVVQGSTASVGLSWAGLEAGKRYLGAVQYLEPDGSVATATILAIDAEQPLPLPDSSQRNIPSQ